MILVVRSCNNNIQYTMGEKFLPERIHPVEMPLQVTRSCTVVWILHVNRSYPKMSSSRRDTASGRCEWSEGHRTCGGGRCLWQRNYETLPGTCARGRYQSRQTLH